MEKKFKIALCILVIALISVIAFAGVYKKDLVSYKETLPEYTVDSEFNGKRVSYFKVSDATEEKIYDKDGKEVDSIPQGADETEYKKETVKVNLDEALTEENFKTVKKIFEGRLKGMGENDYTVRVNKKTGDIVVELADDEKTDTFLQYLLFKGDFSITDSTDGTVFLSRKDVDTASLAYENTKKGEVNVYLDIKFNDEGAKKLQEVSKNYLKTDNEEEQKTINVTVESSTIKSMSFDKSIDDGILRVEIGSGNNNQTVYAYANQAGFIAYIINNGEMPLTYTITTSEFIASELSGNTLYVIIVVLSIATLLIIAYMVFKYKSDGLFAGLSIISAIAILLLFLRYTKTAISLGGFAAMVVLIAVEAYFVLTILNIIKKNSDVENTIYATTKIYLKRLDIIIVLLITAVVFTFMKEVKIYSIGMTLFYGMISFAIANLAFLRTLLIENHK